MEAEFSALQSGFFRKVYQFNCSISILCLFYGSIVPSLKRQRKTSSNTHLYFNRAFECPSLSVIFVQQFAQVRCSGRDLH